MLRLGDEARVRATGEIGVVDDARLGRYILVFPHRPAPPRSEVFSESELQPGHASVLECVAGRDLECDRVWGTAALETEVDAEPKEHFLEGELLKRVRALPREVRGHWSNGSGMTQGHMDRVFEVLWAVLPTQTLQELETALDTGVSMSRWIKLQSAAYSSRCDCCGAEADLETDGTVLRISGQPCPFPDGLPDLTWEINVPSGRLAVANDLRPWFPVPTDDLDALPNLAQLRQYAMRYATVGLAHAFVGNTCPGVYRSDKGVFYIATAAYDEEKDEAKPFDNHVEVAGITTDLWWYSICDMDELRYRAQRLGRPLDGVSVDIVELEPGIYRFHHMGMPRDWDNSEDPYVYAFFERVRDPDPVPPEGERRVDLFEDAEVSAYAYVRRSVATWPYLYARFGPRGEEQTKTWEEMSADEQTMAWRRVADHVLCVLGNGVDWHPRGFPISLVEEDLPDLPPPRFVGQHPWYPIYESSTTLLKRDLSPSFLRLALAVLENMVSFGTEPRVHDGKRHVAEARKQMQLALSRYRALSAQRPDLADPEFLAWVQDEDRADRWVQDFDLGPDHVPPVSEEDPKIGWFVRVRKLFSDPKTEDK